MKKASVLVSVIVLVLFCPKLLFAASHLTDIVSYPFEGIKRTHRTTNSPRPLNMNILEIDLTDQGISLFVTEPNPDALGPDDEVLARRTSTFVDEFGVQIGINGDFTSSERVMECEPRSVEVMKMTRFTVVVLGKSPTGRRRSMPWVGKRSLFRLGLQRLLELISGSGEIVICWQLCDFSAPNWQKQIYCHHARAFVFALK
ncbi:hypothetical protein H8E77_07545 [bacterium]|nr:hypothetical protein [bacterium]